MTESKEQLHSKTGFWRRVTPIFLPILVLALGFFMMSLLKNTGPKAKRKPLERQARLVEVQEIQFTNERTLIQAMGTVRPAREIELQPRVNGEIIWISHEFVPGGRFMRGEAILKIDPTDYEIRVRQRAGEVAQARSDYELELGQQSIAKREFELLGESIEEEDRDLVLRKPQLETVRAVLDTAKAALEQAELDLERTRITSPFNSIVKSREVNLGAYVTSATRLTSLVGIDEYWVEVLVPVAQLKWIRIPDTKKEIGSSVRIYNETAWGEKVYRTGYVTRLASELEEEGRMAQILVSVKDPLSQKTGNNGASEMIIGTYVRVEIEGTDLTSVAAIDRKLLRDGDQVWIMTPAGELEIRPVQIQYRGREQVLINEGIQSGEKIIVTDLTAPVPGMPLRTQTKGAPPSQEKSTENSLNSSPSTKDPH